MARPERRLIFNNLGQPYAIKLANLPAMSVPLPGVYSIMGLTPPYWGTQVHMQVHMHALILIYSVLVISSSFR